jgi:hypothetical protein
MKTPVKGVPPNRLVAVYNNSEIHVEENTVCFSIDYQLLELN